MDHLCAALCIVFILKLCHGINTLSPGQILGGGEALTSPGQIFELGFFSPTKSTKFLGVWYRSTPDVVVWVANTNNPILNSDGVLTLAENGTLVLTSAQSTIICIWSSKNASNPLLQLLDTGNLVLVDNSSNIWQSFDYPGHTRVPGMKMVANPDREFDKHLTSWKSSNDPSSGDFVYRIENQGLSQMIISMRGEKRFRTGHWNGLYFTGLPLVRVPAFEVQTVFRNSRLISLSNPYNDSVVIRLTLNYSGSLQQYIMNEQRDGWVLVYTLPSDACDNYGRCGPNTICTSFKSPLCECLKGFRPKSPKDWSLNTWTRGCTRTLPLDCHREDGFLKVEKIIKYPDPLSFRVDTSMSRRECRNECLKNCSCSAYAAPYLSNVKNGCLMWFGDLIDVKEFNGEVSTAPSIYVRVPISELGKGKVAVKYVYVAIAVSLGILFVGVVFVCIILRNRRKKQAWKKKRAELELPLFDVATIAAATNNFSDENMIGKGGFGPVYKGKLSDGQVVAVKRMSTSSGQGPREFRNEVVLIVKLQHRNLVKILGCCIEGEEMMLIYEYMRNKSLDYFIFDESRSAELSWRKRFDIIMGIARGLLYLHHDSRLKVIHRDLKTSNILLDDNLNAKISDFGLARMFQGDDQTSASTKRVVGTHGYMAPEYVFEGKFSTKSDVFSFGVVILEIVSGKKNRGFKHSSCYHNLLEHAWLLWMENRDLELMDPCYKDSSYMEMESQVKRCIQVGLLCVQNVAVERPVMPSVVVMLSSEESVLPRPNKPGFFLHTSSQRDESAEAGCMTMTMSEIQGR